MHIIFNDLFFQKNFLNPPFPLLNSGHFAALNISLSLNTNFLKPFCLDSHRLTFDDLDQ